MGVYGVDVCTSIKHAKVLSWLVLEPWITNCNGVCIRSMLNCIKTPDYSVHSECKNMSTFLLDHLSIGKNRLHPGHEDAILVQGHSLHVGGRSRHWKLAKAHSFGDKIIGSGCVAQLVERSFLIPEVWGSNPVIGKNLLLNICLLSTVYWKDKNKEKRGREWPI